MTQQLVQALLNEHLVSPNDIEEATRRQIVQGGSLDTNLLELGVPEDVVLRGLAEAYRLPTGDKSDIDTIEGHIPRIFPLVFAETYRLVPYRLVGANLGVLVNGATDQDLFSRIRDRLQLHPVATVTTEARMHYAMHRIYGVALLPRFEALLAKLDGAPPTPLYGPPPVEHMLSWGLPASRIRPGRARGETRKGGPDVAGLLARLDSATDRDAIVEILLEVALGTFDYVALFLVQGERVNGWRSTDPESTNRVARVSLPLAEPSVFQTIHATRGHYLGPIPQTAVNTQLLQTLGRPAPRTAFLASLIVGGRLVGILYADNGSKGVLARRVSGVLLLTHRVGLCFENLIRRRKAMPTPQPKVSSEPQELTFRAESPALPVPEPSPVSEALRDRASVASPVSVALADEPIAVPPQNTAYYPPLAPDADIPEVVAEEVELIHEAGDVSAKDASDYIAFASIDRESPEDAVSEWEDILIETVQTGTRAAPESVVSGASAPPAVTWDDVIAEARKAPSLGVPALGRVNVDVAGHVVDPREMLLDGLDALDVGTRTSAIASLLPLGSAIDDVLRARFPGKILIDPFSPEQSLPPLAECSGLLALLLQRGLDGIPVVLKHLDSADRTQRLFAVYMLLVITYPQALEALARRLFDTEPRVRFLAADALRSYTREPGYTRILGSLREQLKVPVYEVQVSTVQVLGQLRDPRAVPSLIPLVVSPQPELASAAASALAVICAQAFGRDVTRWAEWWQASYNRPRETWLVASLRHPSPQVQRIAFSELQLLTGYTGTFDPMAPAEVREPVVRVWEKWLDDLVHTHNQPENRVSA